MQPEITWLHRLEHCNRLSASKAGLLKDVALHSETALCSTCPVRSGPRNCLQPNCSDKFAYTQRTTGRQVHQPACGGLDMAAAQAGPSDQVPPSVRHRRCDTSEHLKLHRLTQSAVFGVATIAA